MYLNRICWFLLLPAVAGCSMPTIGPHSGFVAARTDLRPIALNRGALKQGALKQGALKKAPPESRFVIPDAGRQTVVIYNHGTTRPQRRENCAAYFNRPPDTLLALRTDGILVFKLCSTATERPGRVEAGSYIYRRMAENEAVIRRLRRAGVPANRIFVAGHSAGGWTALMLKARQPALFNAAIAFAPAFAGRRTGPGSSRHWRDVVRPAQIAEMKRAKSLPALVFAYTDDPFNRPGDLAFLETGFGGSVQLVGYDCETGRKHLIHHYDCKATETTKRMRAFIARRIGAAN